MIKRGNICLIIISIILLIALVSSQDNSTELETPSNITNYTNDTSNITIVNNITSINISIINFFPTEFKIGDAQINIRLYNSGTIEALNLIPIVTGKGFSTYDVKPIESLAPNGKDYLIVFGNFKDSGIFNLTIKLDDKIFYQEVIVIDPNLDTKKIEEEKKELLNNLSIKLKDLKEKYSLLETDYLNKKENEFDLTNVNLDPLKNYINTIEYDIYIENIIDGEAKSRLAYNEYESQKSKLLSSKKKSLITRMKENALIFSAIAGSLLTFFALSELLKKKGSSILGSVKGKVEKEEVKKNSKKKISKKKK
ncbi:MAG: hypothetical protein WC867_03410 [Candidatus Pacearchaeota archaeon]|jgi:hypothetical protein